MKSVAIIQIPSGKVSYEMIHEMCERLRTRLKETDISCGPIVRNFKLYHAGTFQASTRNGKFFVTVSVDADAGPVTIFAEACRRFLTAWIAKRTIPSEWWREFGKVYHQAVDFEFTDVAIHWLTEEEWTSSESHA